MDTPTNEDVDDVLREMRTELREIKAICAKMNTHINFIERSYAALRSPLNWVISKFYGTDSAALEPIDCAKSQSKQIRDQ